MGLFWFRCSIVTRPVMHTNLVHRQPFPATMRRYMGGRAVAAMGAYNLASVVSTEASDGKITQRIAG